jgi:hypothetical protein
MARKYGVAIDLQKNELQNARVQNLGGAPSTPVAGQIYYDTGTNILYWYNGNTTSWVAAMGGTSMTFGAVSGSVVGGANVDGVGTNAARNDHIHALANWGAVTAATTFGISSGNGVAATFSRSDHAHGTPTAPTVVSIGAVSNAGNAPSIQTGTFAARPSGGFAAGRLYVATDTDIFYIDNGASWDQVAPFGASTPANAIGSAGAVGTALTYSRSDHSHQVTSAAPAASAVGDTVVTGAATSFALSDHKHAREAFGAVTAATTFGISAANGAAVTIARSDHTHGTPTAPTVASIGAVANNGNAPYLQTGTNAARPSSGLTVGGIYVDNDDFMAYIATSTTIYSQIAPFALTAAIITQAIGDAAAQGTALSYARGDHKHGMPAFGVPTATLTYGLSAVTGSAVTIARSDHTHGTIPLTAVTPSTQAIGDAAAVGTGLLSAREDHKHAMPAFGTITAQTTFGAASGNGAAATIARSDHTHGTPVHDNAAHATIPLNALATATANYSMGSFLISTSGTPAAAGDLTTKSYVDAVAAGNRDVKDSVRVASTAALTLATGFANGQVIDGITLVTGDRILVKNQAAPAENGIWIVTAGAPTRATDADASAEISLGTQLYVESGTANGGQIWIVSAVGATPWVPGTSSSTWVMYFAITTTQAGAGLAAAANVLSIGGGVGMVISADSIAVDRAGAAAGSGTLGKVPLIYTQDFGDGASFTFTITHGLGTRDVITAIFPNSTPWDEQEWDVEHTSTTTVTLRTSLATAPTSNQYRVVVMG